MRGGVGCPQQGSIETDKNRFDLINVLGSRSIIQDQTGNPALVPKIANRFEKIWGALITQFKPLDSRLLFGQTLFSSNQGEIESVQVPLLGQSRRIGWITAKLFLKNFQLVLSVQDSTGNITEWLGVKLLKFILKELKLSFTISLSCTFKLRYPRGYKDCLFHIVAWIHMFYSSFGLLWNYCKYSAISHQWRFRIFIIPSTIGSFWQ